MATSEKNNICCFSGHRRIVASDALQIPELLSSLIDSLIKRGFTTFRAGGAIGFDTICALKVLEFKKERPELNVRLELCLPCKDQSSVFKSTERKIYEYVVTHADSVSYASDVYRAGCMHKRNRMLVDGADLCVAYLTSQKGGTAYTVSYAVQNGLEIINIRDLMKNKA